MNSDEFDALIRGSDPTTNPIKPNAKDPLLDESSRHWKTLSARRVIVRKRMSLSVAALSVLAVIGGSVVWIGHHQSDRDPIAAIDVSPRRQGQTSADATQSAVARNASQDRRREQFHSSENRSATEQVASGTQSGDSAAHSDAPKRRVRNEPSSRAGSGVPDRLNEFAGFIDRAGTRESVAWRQSREFLAKQNEQTQLAAIAMVPQLDSASQRSKAFELVCEAAGRSEGNVLVHWLSEPKLSSMAWERLVATASFQQAIALIEIARGEDQRQRLCERIAASPDPGVIDVLLRLVREPVWRAPVASSATQLHPTHIQSLIMLMRERNLAIRTAAAFVLTSVPGDHVDQVVASMILSGRYLQPAYLVLLSRNTPKARQFLAQAASRPELTPALISARLHFANIQPQLQQWIAESKGNNHESSDTTQTLAPDVLDTIRCASLPGVLGDIG